MTKKQSIISFIDENVDQSNCLVISEQILESGQSVKRKFIVKSNNTLKSIFSKFTDDLVGNIREEEPKFIVVSWSVEPK